ncbi:MAG: LacI family DNA-binding transcriptional regulator [Hyphomicrobiales bacterium]
MSRSRQPRLQATTPQKDKVQTASIRDVARLAGVSIASVSRALNVGTGNVSAATRERVLRAAEELKYAPNQIGRALRAQTTNTYAFILSNIQNNLFSAVAWELERLIAERGAGLLLYTSNEDPKIQDDCLDDARSRQVAGIFFMCAVESDKLADTAEREQCVFINRRVPGIQDVPFVGIDDYSAAQHLFRSAVKRRSGPIGVIHGPKSSDTSRRRLEGFLESASAMGCTIEADAIIEAELSIESGYAAANQLFSQRKFETVFCGNDQIAYGVHHRLAELDIAVPDETSVFGFDDNPLNQWLAPWLSTVRVPHLRFAANALSGMEALVAGQNLGDSILPYELILK